MAEEGNAAVTADTGATAAAEGTIATAATAVDTPASGATIATEGDKGADGKPKDATGDKGKTEGAPEKYEAFKLPEGVEINDAAMAEFQGVAKELNLSQETAQKLVDLQSKLMTEVATGQAKLWETTMTEWKDAAKNDKEYGGANFDANVSVAKKAIDAAFPVKEDAERFKAMLDSTGMGNNPEFLRYTIRMGKLIGDDKIHRGQAPGDNAKVPPHIALYPTMQKQQQDAA